MSVEGEIADSFIGREWSNLADIDRALIDMDGTPNKERLGANAIVGVSMATARAMASADEKPLYEWLAPQGGSLRLPVPHLNVINGGAHAANPLVFQEFMLAPLGAPNYREALRAGAEAYSALRSILKDRGHAVKAGRKRRQWPVENDSTHGRMLALCRPSFQGPRSPVLAAV